MIYKQIASNFNFRIYVSALAWSTFVPLYILLFFYSIFEFNVQISNQNLVVPSEIKFI